MFSHIKLLNEIDSNKVSGIIERILFALSSQRKFIFTQDEYRKLESNLSLSSSDLLTLLEAMKNIFLHAAENALQSHDLKEQLINSGLMEAQSQLLSCAWEEHRDALFPVANKASTSAWQLKNISWEFHAEVASVNTARQKHPIAFMNLSLYEPNAYPEVTEKEHKHSKVKELTVQMDYNELLAFYKNLEVIQKEIDNLRIL